MKALRLSTTSSRPTPRVADLGGLMLVGIAALGALLAAPPAWAQETDAPPQAEAVDEAADVLEAAADEPASDAVADTAAEPATPDADETAPEAEPAGDDADDAASGADTAAGASGADDATTTDAGSSNLLGVLVTLAVLIVPILLGNWLAKQWRMPEQAWRVSLILASLAIAVLCVTTGQFKGGPDLAGGITLVYELAGGDAAAAGDEADAGRKVDIDRLIEALQQRVDPTGTKEVSIRNYGGAIEIIIPRAGPADLEYMKRRITDLGQLEFRIVADRRWTDDRQIIELAEKLPPGETIVSLAGKDRAQWVPYKEDEFEGDSRIVRRTAGGEEQALVLIDQFNVTGQNLDLAAKDYDDTGSPIVRFTFDNIGGRKFGRFTGENLPNPATPEVQRALGILLDERLISAPNIRERITSQGQISGRSMDEREVDFIISILNAGSLPAALNKTPISEETVSPTLGATTIEKGKFAILVSLAAVLAFILLYYRFAGLVACLALAATLLLVLAAMVVVQAAFTLPGLAGLVLTVGMAVDANVLIFERIREELAKGAGLRMAIRNGFGRATTTIVDANVTTLIAAVVLYSVGTGPIKGFGVTLFLGIVMSMYTAIFCSRTVFDIAERRRWIKNLSFGSILGKTNIDFLGKRHIAAVLSLAVIAAGIAGVVGRGSNLLNIDFTGGSSVTMVLKPDAAMPIAEVEAALRDELGDKNLVVVQRVDALADEGSAPTRYTINSSVDNVEEVQDLLAETFAGKLQTQQAALGDAEAYEETGGSTGTLLDLTFNEGDAFGEGDGLAHDALLAQVKRILAEQDHAGVLPRLENTAYKRGSSQRFKEWTLRLGLDETETRAVAQQLADELAGEPLFPLASKIGGRVAGDMQVKAISAILLSLLGIVGYLWFRFQNLSYGLAAVVALVHDVLVTLGAIALSAWVVSGARPLASALQIDAFQISLPILAAFITIIGYSLNDTIVVFDRIREVRGKSPRLTADTINKSVNQTLSRTLLTSLTTLIVVLILYFFGGAGIHAFAFALVVGVIVGTYSSIFVASPALLWMAGTGDDGAAAVAEPPRAAA